MADHKLKLLAGFLKQGDWTYAVASSGAAQFRMTDKSSTTHTVSKDCIERVEKKEEVKSGLLSKEIIFEVHFTNGQSVVFKADQKAFQTIFEAQYSSKKAPTQVVETTPTKGEMIAGAALLALIVFGMYSCAANKDEKTEDQQPKSFRTFTETDFKFTAKESKYKDIIIAGVNRVHREIPGCDDIHHHSATISSSKGTKKNPVFFVSCGNAEKLGAFNVWFSKSDIEKNAPIKVAKPAQPKEETTNIPTTPIENNGEGLGLSGGVTHKQANGVAVLVRLNGYSCDSISNIRPFVTKSGFTISCNNFSYEYEVEDVGGNFKVTVN